MYYFLVLNVSQSKRTKTYRRKIMRVLNFFILVCFLFFLNGCMTFSGEKLTELKPLIPMVSPKIEESVGDFTFHLDGGAMVTDNKAGRIINNAILEKWKSNQYISDFNYVKKESFTGDAQYNLTLSGHQEGQSSVAMQIISGLTLLLLPSAVNTTYDLTYKLENVKTGKKYTTKVSEDMSTVMWLLYFPVLPFAFVGADNTMENISENIYQNFVQQGAFSRAQ